MRLAQDVARPRPAPEFIRFARSEHWQVAIPRPDVDRLEYQLELIHSDGGSEYVCDPGNPARVPGVFGDRSVIEFPGYEPPAWTKSHPPEGSVQELLVRSRALRARARILVWSPDGVAAAEPLPLLLVHDGPEMAALSGVTRFVAAMIIDERLPLMHVALLQPVDRDRHYSASVAYSRALATELLPAVVKLTGAPPRGERPVVMGASLGGVAALHAHRSYPDVFGGLYLQSSSFFRPNHDDHESGFPQFRRINRFVDRLITTPHAGVTVPVTMTCGTVEENLTNNREVAAGLREHGYEVDLFENRDAHNWIAWRDTFDPWLVDLLNRSFARATDAGRDGA